MYNINFLNSLSEKNTIKDDIFFIKVSNVCIFLFLFSLIVLISLYKNNSEIVIFNYLTFFICGISVSLGSMIFVLIQHITRCGWSIIVRRIPETFMYLTFFFIFLFIPIIKDIDVLFVWTNIGIDDIALIKKSSFLNKNFFIIRSIIYFVVWFFISTYFYKNSLKQDINKENFVFSINMWRFSPICILLFALSLTFSSFDWIMSLQPHWFSTIFGVYFFSTCILMSLSFIIIICCVLQNRGYLINVLNKEHYHDLGKLLFGFVIFWAYIAFSQFMLYWYANIPEEIEFYVHRLHGNWKYVSWLMPFTHFFIPFFLLISRSIKRNKNTLFMSSVYVIFVQIINVYWLIMPICHLKINFIYILSSIFSFIFIFSFLFYLFFYFFSKNSIFPSNDPRLIKSINFENF